MPRPRLPESSVARLRRALAGTSGSARPQRRLGLVGWRETSAGKAADRPFHRESAFANVPAAVCSRLPTVSSGAHGTAPKEQQPATRWSRPTQTLRTGGTGRGSRGHCALALHVSCPLLPASSSSAPCTLTALARGSVVRGLRAQRATAAAELLSSQLEDVQRAQQAACQCKEFQSNDILRKKCYKKEHSNCNTFAK